MLSSLTSTMDKEKCDKLESIYNAYRDKIFFWADRIVRNHSIAEDIVQNVILKLVEKKEIMDCFQDIESPETNAYLAVMTKNMAFNLLKKDRIEKEHLAAYLYEMSACGYKDDVESMLNKMNAEVLLEEIKNIPEIYKTVFMLRYVDEYSVREISGLLNITEANTRKRLERAKARIREIIDNKIALIS